MKLGLLLGVCLFTTMTAAQANCNSTNMASICEIKSHSKPVTERIETPNYPPGMYDTGDNSGMADDTPRDVAAARSDSGGSYSTKPFVYRGHSGGYNHYNGAMKEPEPHKHATQAGGIAVDQYGNVGVVIR